MKINLMHLTVVAVTFLSSAALVSASGINYVCASSISTSVCNTLQTTIAGQYSSTFSNANASIYVAFNSSAGLGESLQYHNFTSYTDYRNALIADSSGDAIDVAALASLPATEPSLYGGANVEVTTALAQALGLGAGAGVTSSLGFCANPGSSGCYDGVIYLAPASNLSNIGYGYYYGTGIQAANQFNIYTVIEHETDEILGTASCIGTTTGSLVDNCGGSSPSAVDLFRYQSSGVRVLKSTTPGAYFSYNGGVTNGAGTATYNTVANGNDYADFIQQCQHVQDAVGCPGSTQYITTDGGAEIHILDAVGYNLNEQSPVPEPTTLSLLATGLGSVAALIRLRYGKPPA